MRIYGLSHQGMVRENNEDSMAVYENGIKNLKNLAVIADGMGGHQSGEVASSYAIHSFISYLKDMDLRSGDVMDFLNDAVQFANDMVYKKSLSAPKFYGMGTTFTACTIDGGKGFAVHVGDSRLYLKRGGELRLITSDHTYVNEMVRAGYMTEAEAKESPRRNFLTRALGVDDSVEVDGYVFDFLNGDTVIICTDGLTNMLTGTEIYKILDGESDITVCAEKLIETANRNGGFDNVTVVLLRSQEVIE